MLDRRRWLRVVLAVLPAMAVLGWSNTAGAAGGIEKWAHKYSANLTKLATAVVYTYESDHIVDVSWCKGIKKAVASDTKIPTPPGSSYAKPWRTTLKDLGTYTAKCISAGFPEASSKELDAGARAFATLIGRLEGADVPIGVTLATRISAAIKGSASSTTSATTTTSTAPLAIGQSQAITDDGLPYVTVAVDQVVNPAAAAETFESPKTGDVFVAVEFTLVDSGSTTFTTDIYDDVKLYDTSGQGFTGNFDTTTSGPSFPSGEVNLAPGGTASGWVMFTVPSGAAAYVTFTPDSGFAKNATVRWNL